MNTAQLIASMNSDIFIQSEMGGVYSANTLPINVMDKPTILISNLQPNYLPGSHWIALYCPPNGESEYFDSLAENPTEPFTSFLIRNGMKYVYSRKITQGAMETCGYFCLFWAYHRTRGHSFQNILNMLSENPNLNDITVSLFCKKHFPLAFT